MRLNTPLISIIIPVYNIAAYLPRCLDSVCKQTYPNLEIILIDDGSTDESLKICQNYAQQNPRIRVFHQENKGVSAARNLGLEQLTGDFFAFIDGDDWVVAHCMERLLKLAEDYQADIAQACSLQQQDDHLPTFTQRVYAKGLVPTQDVFLNSPFPNTSNIWAKLYRTSALKNLRFNPTYALGEDDLFFFEAVQLAKRVAATEEPLYVYCRRSGSATGAISVQTRYHYFLIWQAFAQKTESLSSTALRRARENVFGAAATLSVSVILLGSDPRYPQAGQEALSFLRQNRALVWENSIMGIPGKVFIACFLCFPTLITGFCRLPGIKQLLLKAAPKRFA